MIETARDGARLTLRLNAPERHNALDFAAMGRLHEALDAAAADPDLRVIVLTGTGKSFCSGVALGALDGADMSDNPLTRLCDRVEGVDLPTIAALNGGVYGGGAELALACDFRIGVRGMKMQVPPARLGIHYEAPGIERVRARLGDQMARRIFLLAERFGDEALLSAGAIDRLVAPEALAEEVAEMAGTLAALAPRAVQGMKRTIRELSAGTLDTAAAKARVAAAFASEDHAEGLAAAREKRPPVFRGR
ncbi:MAG: enoyl-CoA hydratase/isomerase family protein [Pseudomonadota bacterium]